MSRRPWIIVVSIAAHIGVGIGLFASGIWDLDRLEAGRGRSTVIGVLLPPATEGSPPPAPQQKPKNAPQKPVVRVVVQPPVDRPKDAPPSADASARPGDGTNPDANGQIGDGTGAEPCTHDCAPIGSISVPGDVPVIRKEPRMVAPNILDMNRISGQTQIEPDGPTKQQMAADGHFRVTGTFKVCVSEAGEVSSVTLVKSTSHAAYDDRLLEAVRRWRYRPLMVGGEAYAACGPVTFVYTMSPRLPR